MAKKTKISIDPVTRIEGHLKVEVTVEGGKVTDAWLTGGMFRGIEMIMKGRDPRDASQITQRICGVCPSAHSTAACRALDEAFKVKVPTNGRITRNLIFGANWLQSHILHFYHLAALDYVAGPATAPFVPRYAKPDLRLDKKTNEVAVGQYLEALEIRRIAHEMVAMFGGRMPHLQGQMVGGATEIPTEEKLKGYADRLAKVKAFVVEKYVPTVYLVGKVYADLLKTGIGYKDCICGGVFPLTDDESKWMHAPASYIDGKDGAFDKNAVKEFVKHSWYDDSCTNLAPNEGKTIPTPGKKGAYSWVKSPRYAGKAVEVGPVARMWCTNPDLSPMGQKALKDHFGLTAKKFRDLGDMAFSIMGRHVARAEETYMTALMLEQMLKDVKPGGETMVESKIPDSGEGLGVTEASRGTLLHYLKIKDKKVENYQIVAATIWTCNPRDDKDQLGPVEKALIGVPVPDVKNPVNVARVIRAVDP